MKMHVINKESDMALQPLADRIVAKPVEAEAKTASGILLPDQSKEKTQVAKVLAVGKDVKEVKVGDSIVHTEYGPSRFKQASEELLILKEEDVLAVVKA
jgi:chaperonin GroES